MYLSNLTWPQAKAYFEGKDTVLLPVGSCECHGTHLPLGTDAIVPEHIVERLQKELDILAAPGVAYGASDYFMGFPGTVSIGGECLRLVLSKIMSALFDIGARRFIIVNGHGGNIPAIEEVCYDLSRKGALCAVMNWWQMAGAIDPRWKGGHAGGEETAAIMAIMPENVDRAAIRDQSISDISQNIKAVGLKAVSYKNVELVMPRHVPLVSDNGWVGPDHPSLATAEWGREMLDAVTAYIASFARELMSCDIDKALNRP